MLTFLSSSPYSSTIAIINPTIIKAIALEKFSLDNRLKLKKTKIETSRIVMMNKILLLLT